MSDTAAVPEVIEAAPPAPAPECVLCPPAPAPETPAGVFQSIDWKNPVPSVIKLATHLHSLEMLTAAERLTMLQGSLLHVINTSSMEDAEKEAARVFVNTMLPHVVETAISGIEAASKVAAAEKKASDLLASVMAKQPTMVVKNVEVLMAEAGKRSWKCW
jgi:hypothetical protein